MSNKMSFKSDSKIVQCDFFSLCFLFDVLFCFFTVKHKYGDKKSHMHTLSTSTPRKVILIVNEA